MRKKSLQELMRERANGVQNSSVYTNEPLPKTNTVNNDIKTRVDQLYKVNTNNNSMWDKVQARADSILNNQIDINKLQKVNTNASTNIYNNNALLKNISTSKTLPTKKQNPYFGAGNIDLNNRKVVKNEDGSISTERSLSFEEDGKEVLIPTVVNGKIVSEEEAIRHYEETGEYLGKFNSIKEANEYAEKLHERQDKYYNNKIKPIENKKNLKKINLAEVRYEAEKKEKEKRQQEELSKVENKGLVDKAIITAKHTMENILQKPKEFYDGYQFGDITKSASSTLVGGVAHTIEGVKSVGDAIANTGAYGVATIADIAGQKGFSKRLINAIKANQEENQEATDKVNQLFDKNSVLGETSNQALNSAGQSSVFGSLGTGGASKVANALTFSMGASSGFDEAYSQENANGWEALLKATGSGASSYITENMFDWLGYGGNKLTKGLKEKIGQQFTQGVASGLAKLGFSAVGEGAEEIAEEVLNKKVVNTLVNKVTGENRYNEDIDVAETVSNALVAMFSVLGTGTAPTIVNGNYESQQIKQQQSISKLINNSNLTQDEKDSLLRFAEKNNLDDKNVQTLIENRLNEENQPMTINNEQVSNNNQQVIPADSKIAQNQISEQISNDGENNPKNNYNNVENLQNYKNSAKKYNIDLNNDTVKTIFGTADRRGIKVSYDDRIFSNSSQNAIWRLNEDGSREIILNPNADTQKALESIQVHELTHDMEGTKEYEALSKVVLDMMKTQESYQDAFNNLKDMYSKVYDNTSDNFNSLVEQEAVADFLGENLGNQEFLNELVKSQPRSTIQKIYDWIVDKINKLTGYNKEKIYWQDVKTKFEKAFNSDFNNQNNTNNKYHISENFSNEIDKTLNNKLPSNTQVKARDYTPKILVENGIKDLPMLITQRHIKSIIYTLQEAHELGLPTKNVNYHGLGKDLLIKAIDNLDNPQAIYKTSNNNYLVVTEFKDNNNREIVVPIQINGKGLYNDVYIDENQIKSVYGRNNLTKYLNNNNFEVIYNKKEASALNERIQYPNISNNASNTSIPNSDTNVNNGNTAKYSMQENEKNTQNNTGKWQEFLQKHSINKGTRSTIKEVKLPISETKFQDENNINSTAKAQNYEKRQNSKFKRQMSEFLGVSRFNKNNKTILDNAISQLRNEYNSDGKISENTRNTIFKDMYNNLIKEDSNYYNEYKDLKNEIENTEINISTQIKKDITDYRDFTREFGNNINISKDNLGIEVDSYYKELSSRYPELFSDKITNPADQLRRIAEISKSISKSENNISAYADKYLGKEYESWARRQFDIITDNLIKEYEVIDNYNQDRFNQSKKDDYIRPKEDEIKWIYENRAQLQKEYEKINNKTLLTRKEKAIVDRLLKDEMSFEEILPGFNKEAIAKVYTAKQQLEYVNNEIKKYKQDVKNNLKEFAENLIEKSENWKDKKARHSLRKRNSTKKYTGYNE